MTGHLHLTCSADEQGRSYLREQSFCAPIHIGKPFTEEGVLVVNLVNPTAGLFEGDAISCRVKVEPGAKLLLTSPSASRAHRMGDGAACLDQTYQVGGFLEVLPELFIPQAGSRYRQTTSISVDSGGELIFFESLAPGRVASGETFAFQQLDWSTELFFNNIKVLKENYSLRPGDLSLHALQKKFPYSYYASCFAIGPAFEQGDGSEIRDLESDTACIGCSRLSQGGWVIKILAADSISFRAIQDRLRQKLYEILGRQVPALRR